MYFIQIIHIPREIHQLFEKGFHRRRNVRVKLSVPSQILECSVILADECSADA